MSRIGQQPVPIPAGVKVQLADGKLTIEGPKGKLDMTWHRAMRVEIAGGKAIKISRPDDERQNRALHGLTRSLIANMVLGVTRGFEKRLKIEGVGYQARLEGVLKYVLASPYAKAPLNEPPEGVELVEVEPPATIYLICEKAADKPKLDQFLQKFGVKERSEKKVLSLTVGFSQAVRKIPPDGVLFELPDPTTIVIRGADKQKVGQFAAEVRAVRKPEPYKGKGIRYENEQVRRKEGKAFTTGAQ